MYIYIYIYLKDLVYKQFFYTYLKIQHTKFISNALNILLLLFPHM